MSRQNRPGLASLRTLVEALALAFSLCAAPVASFAGEEEKDEEEATPAADDGWTPVEEAPAAPPADDGWTPVEPQAASADPGATPAGPPPAAKQAWQWIQEAWDHRAAGRHEEARAALRAALEAGADPQAIDMELGYLSSDEKDYDAARLYYRDAAAGPDAALRRQARLAILWTPRHLWGDFYGDAWGWHRLLPEQHSVTDFVPTVRLRGYARPWLRVDFDFFVFAQASRDFASRAGGPQGYPLIYADNTVMLGGGAQFMFAKRTVGLFAQAGPAIHLVQVEGVPPVEFDFRGGAFASVATPECNPAPVSGKPGARPALNPCADVYADLVFVVRPETNLLFFVRGRLSLSYLVTGPVSWAPFLESRFIKDVRNHYYNNQADVGVGHRWRLLTPFGLDLALGIHAGSYLGLEAVDPAPSPLGFLDLRLQLATYVVF